MTACLQSKELKCHSDISEYLLNSNRYPGDTCNGRHPLVSKETLYREYSFWDFDFSKTMFLSLVYDIFE